MAGLSNADRIAKIQALADQSPFEGERAAARLALERIRATEAAHTAELERMLGFGRRPEHAEADAGSHAALMGRLDTEASSFGEYS